VQSELAPGPTGVFDVVADGALIFSKNRAGRFPRADEIVQALRKLS
jgi:selT/selW/selH-like putative selenoprotein